MSSFARLVNLIKHLILSPRLNSFLLSTITYPKVDLAIN